MKHQELWQEARKLKLGSEFLENLDTLLTSLENQNKQCIIQGVMPSFLITYKEDEIDKELYWQIDAKNEVEAIDLFWKKHDVLCDIINVKPN